MIMLRRQIQGSCRMCLKAEESRNEIPLNGQSQQSEDRGRITEEEKLIDTTHTSASEWNGQTQESAHKRKDREKENLINIKHLPMDLMKGIYGVYILILVNRRNTYLDENIVKKAAMKELNIAVDMENSFQKWTYNKTEGNYVFRDWIPSDGEYNETDLRKTQLEILQAIKRNRTKFVLVFPLNVWSQNTKLNDMGRWNICRQKTITHSAP